MDVLTAMHQRTSKRVFLPDPPARELIQEIVQSAARAPSAINLQPWEFTIVGGEELPRLTRVLLKAFRERNVGCNAGTGNPLPQRYKDRQYSSFIGLSELLDAGPEDVQKFVNEGSLGFYGAPTAIIITKDSVFPDRYLTSAGIMIGYLLLAAEAKGLSTCPVGLVNQYSDTILDFINLEGRDLVLGLAIGHADPEAGVNRLKTPREPIESLTRWYG